MKNKKMYSKGRFNHFLSAGSVWRTPEPPKVIPFIVSQLLGWCTPNIPKRKAPVLLNK